MRTLNFKGIFIFMLLLAAAISSTAQFGQPGQQSNNDLRSQKKFYVGGGLGFGMSSYSTSLMVAPIVGYRITPNFDVGARLNYTYNFYDKDYYGVKFSTHNVGIGAYTRYYLHFFSALFAHAEYEALNYDKYVRLNANNEVEKERAWVSSFFVGGGYRQWVGNFAFVDITVLWNLLDSYDSPYSNPIFRIGVGVGL